MAQSHQGGPALPPRVRKVPSSTDGEAGARMGGGRGLQNEKCKMQKLK